ncbi:MAG: hypothetical protein AB2821_14975 [Candidatus Thiodiazotropha endolucinida]
MTLAFIKQLNEYVIEATIEASDEEILARIGNEGYPSQQDIHQARDLITQAVKEQRQNRLSQQRAAFEVYKQEQNTTKNITAKRSVPEMLSEIVAAMQNKDKVPEGILLAFREQSQNGSEDDIANIWQNLVELGLIDPNDTKE